MLKAEDVAKRLGYTLPLNEFGIARWESEHGFAFVAVSSDGEGGLDIEVGHRVDGTEEKIGTLKISANDKSEGAWLGEKDPGPVVVLGKILSALEIMGSPVFVDSPEIA